MKKKDFNKTPLSIRGVFYILLFMFIAPFLGAKELEYVKYAKQDYIEQLSHLGELYTKNITSLKLRKSQKRYLARLYKKIQKKNRRFVPDSVAPTFFIVKDENPFYFSLPNNYYFFSQGLIQKYFKNEMSLVSCLSYMMLQASNRAYLKRIVVPIGYISTDQIISLIKLPLDLKADLNKAVFWALQKTGFGGSYYLQWIQLQNRNTLDFSRQIGDPQFITKEEFLFKQFISKENSFSLSMKQLENNSSKGFYRFLKGI